MNIIKICTKYMWANSEPRRLVETVQWQGILLSNCLMVTIKSDQWFYFFFQFSTNINNKNRFLACMWDRPLPPFLLVSFEEAQKGG